MPPVYFFVLLLCLVFCCLDPFLDLSLVPYHSEMMVVVLLVHNAAVDNLAELAVFLFPYLCRIDPAD